MLKLKISKINWKTLDLLILEKIIIWMAKMIKIEVLKVKKTKILKDKKFEKMIIKNKLIK